MLVRWWAWLILLRPSFWGGKAWDQQGGQDAQGQEQGRQARSSAYKHGGKAGKAGKPGKAVRTSTGARRARTEGVHHKSGQNGIILIPEYEGGYSR